MYLNESDKQEFGQAIYNTFNLLGFNIDKNRGIESLENDLVEDFNDLNDSQTKNARLNFFKIPGASEEDYSERIINIENGRKVICGIRFKGGNPDFPFVEIIPNFEISLGELIPIYKKYLEKYFSIFKPSHLRISSGIPPKDELMGQTYLIAFGQDIKKSAPWPEEKDLSFSKINDNSFFEFYNKAYSDFHEEVPELKDRVPINSPEDMKVSMDEGLLKYVELNGEKIGLVAAKKKKFLGHPGIYFNEILLLKNWKGKGLAKSIQRKFISKYCLEECLVWGTIDFYNKPSYKTALANGRQPVRFEIFMEIKSC